MATTYSLCDRRRSLLELDLRITYRNDQHHQSRSRSEKRPVRRMDCPRADTHRLGVTAHRIEVEPILDLHKAMVTNHLYTHLINISNSKSRL